MTGLNVLPLLLFQWIIYFWTYSKQTDSLHETVFLEILDGIPINYLTYNTDFPSSFPSGLVWVPIPHPFVQQETQ